MCYIFVDNNLIVLDSLINVVILRLFYINGYTMEVLPFSKHLFLLNPIQNISATVYNISRQRISGLSRYTSDLCDLN